MTHKSKGELMSKKTFVVVLLTSIIKISAVSMTSIAQISEFPELSYPQFCLLASKKKEVFDSFRSHGTYRAIVETVHHHHQGVQLLQQIKTNYPELMPKLPGICKDDLVGGPVQFNYPEVGFIAPTVLRYVKIAGDLIREFGDLSNFRIAEIGCGFGGQCKILHDICGFLNYVMIDLPECCELIKTYMSHFDVKNFEVIDCYNITKNIPCDLVISNWAFSEVCKEGQLHYMEKIINAAPNGYMQYVHSPAVQPFTIHELAKMISGYGRNVKIIGDKILIWQTRS